MPDDKEALKNYEAEQLQRYIERQIRKWKRFEAGACDIENQEKAHAKVKEWERRLKDHLDNNPQLRRDYDREKVKTPVERPSELKLRDIRVPKSLGAAAKKIYVKSDIDIRGIYTIKQGSTITSVKVIAGNGVKRQIDDIKRLVEKYKKNNGDDTKERDWQKMIGFATIKENNKIAEVHWYQCKDIGKVEFKVKRWLDEG